MAASVQGLGPFLPASLRAQYAHLLPRLRLIPEFSAWFELSARYCSRPCEDPSQQLWDCLSLGAPLCTLLELLGIHASGKVVADSHNFNPDADEEERGALVASFIQGVRQLEMQGRVSYGEVFRTEDLFDGSAIGFAKVLRTVERVLRALEATYPGLFVLGTAAQVRRQEIKNEILGTERRYMRTLTTLAEHCIIISEAFHPEESILICLCANLERLLPYHAHILHVLEENFVQSKNVEDWTRIFAFDVALLHTAAISAYKSYCADFLGLVYFLESQLKDIDPILSFHIEAVLDLVSTPLLHINSYSTLLQALIEHTMPTDNPFYVALCSAQFNWQETASMITLVGNQVKTMWSLGPIKSRAFLWRDLDPELLGTLILDDRLVLEKASGEIQCSLFMFDSMFICCKESIWESYASTDEALEVDLPASWELGSAVKAMTPLVLLHAVPAQSIVDVHDDLDMKAFSVQWTDSDTDHELIFYCATDAQLQRWMSTLSTFLPHPSARQHGLSSANEDSNAACILSSYHQPGSQRISRPRPWSLLARKGPHSESSSLLAQPRPEIDHHVLLSPTMLPHLFRHSTDPLPHSPLSISSLLPDVLDNRSNGNGLLAHDFPLTPPPEPMTATRSNSTSSLGSDDSVQVMDLTGQISMLGSFPAAHGGYGDVWKGLWKSHIGAQTVAIKVLRAKVDDTELEQRITKRLRRELKIWQRLSHPNVIQLYGIVSNLGPYTSFVCPWLEHGCISKYLKTHASSLRIVDRLELLCDVAAGLSYLHEYSVVHGDLTGSNILVDANRHACLCDFGLSSITAEIHSASFLTSTVGGAVRWSAPDFYQMEEEDELAPQPSTRSDVYSFGSVMLEVLSGRVPYHYLWNDGQVLIYLSRGIRPRRPPDVQVTDTLWGVIQQCWSDIPMKRPSTLEVLRQLRGFCSLEQLKC